MPPEVIGGRLFGGLRPCFRLVGFAGTFKLRNGIPQTSTTSNIFDAIPAQLVSKLYDGRKPLMPTRPPEATRRTTKSCPIGYIIDRHRLKPLCAANRAQ